MPIVTIVQRIAEQLKTWLGAALVAVALSVAVGAAQTQTAVHVLDQPSRHLDKSTPNWLSVGAAYRFRVEGRTGLGFNKGNDESAYGLSRLLVNIGVKPTPWLRFHFQGQDARAPGKDNATPLFRDPFDVRQAYVELGEPEKGWVRVRGGRQELKYGGQRLVGPLDWTNTARQFDAVKATFGKKDASVDVFASSVVRIDDKAFNRHRDGHNLHGMYGQLNKLIPKATFEPYLLWKTVPSVTGEMLRVGDADIYTGGFRFVRPLPANFDSAMEVAGQWGNFAGANISAWAGYWILGYTAPDVPLTPRFSIEYSHAGGDNDPNDGKLGTFDQLYPTGHLWHGVAYRLGWRNLKDVRAGVEVKPLPKVKLAVDFFSFWLANRNDNMYAVNGSVAIRTPEGGAGSAYIGRELDVTVGYKPSAGTTIGGGVGRFLPGTFVKQTAPGAAHTFPYVFLNYVL